MQKLSDISKPITADFIEDCLDDFIHTLGYRIYIFNNFGGNDWKGYLYTPLSIDNIFNIFSYHPSVENNYHGFIICLTKKACSFQNVNDNEYARVNSAMNQVQKTLNNCNVYYRVITKANGFSNDLDSSSFEIHLVIIDRLSKISNESIRSFDRAQEIVNRIIYKSVLREDFVVKFEIGYLVIVIKPKPSKINYKEALIDLSDSLEKENLSNELLEDHNMFKIKIKI